MTVEDESSMPDNYFSDITSADSYYRDILLAVEFGVIHIDAGESFRPSDAVTREFAAQTLNSCLGFRLEENPEYTYSDYADTAYPDDVQVAVNRSWFALSGGKALPAQPVTTAETTAMLADAKAVLAASVIDENYNSQYTFADGVVEIPQGTEVEIDAEYNVTVTNYSPRLSAGDIFVVYSNGYPVALKAQKVTSSSGTTVIAATKEGAENAIVSVDSQGSIAVDLEDFEASETTTYSVTATSKVNVQSEEMQISPQGISYDKKSKKLTAKQDIKLGSSAAGSITVEVANLTLNHSENTGRGAYEAYLTADTTVTKTISFDFGNYVGLPSRITIGYVNIGGIGSVSLDVDLALKGGLTEVEKGVVTTGFDYTRSSGFRIIAGYKKTSYSFAADAEVKVGLTLSANIDLVVVGGRIWATVGVKGYYKMKDFTYVDGERPCKCETIGGYLYANVGVSVKINYILDKKSWSQTYDIYTEQNSPVRVYYHYEDGQLVDSCARGAANNDAYVKYTTHTNSIHFNPSPNRAQGSYGGGSGSTTEPVVIWEYKVESDGNATITKYRGNASAVAIPSKIDGYTVTKIGYQAFRDNKTIRSVTMTDSIIKIEWSAFENCTNLSNIRLPKYIE